MSFTIHEADQGTPEWLAARAGRATGSRAKDILSAIKTGEAAARRDYRIQLICERLTGSPQESGFINAEMQRGTDLEPEARAAYEALTGNMVRQTGFLTDNDIMAGCSLDGDIDDFKGIFEAKCPKSATHLNYLRTKDVSAYIPQITHNLFITGAEWCDFLSYDDRFPEELQIFLVRIYAKELDIPGYSVKLSAFLKEVSEEEANIRNMAKEARSA